MRPIKLTSQMVIELALAVEAACGIYPRLEPFWGPYTPAGTCSLSYVGRDPGIVVFELCVILAATAADVACRSGYHYGASDFVDELRALIIRVRAPNTHAVGRDLVFYWPVLQLVDEACGQSGRAGRGEHRRPRLGVVDGGVPLRDRNAGMA